MQARFGSTAILLLLVFFSSTAGLSHSQADNTPIAYGISRSIHSKILNEDRTALIRLPDDYGSSKKKYSVLYKLDGSLNIFIRTSGTVDYLADMTDRAPDHIVVGIVNTDRMRDMSLEKEADKFVQFIGSELIPFIESNYRTSSFRILSGQSLSSIFALYTFLKQPALFDAYILSSFGFYNESVASLFQNQLKQSRDLENIGRKYIFITNGKMDSYDIDGSVTRRGTRFLDSLRQTVPAGVLVNYKVYDDEGHVPFATIYDGLRWIYSQEEASNSYLGQAPPGETAVVFATGIVSKNDVHSRLAISPDGKDMCWTSLSALGPQGTARLLCVSKVNKQWTRPQVPVFAANGPAANPLFSPDGTRLFYISKEDEKNGWRTQYAERTPSGWSAAKTDGFMLDPTSSFTKSGEVYFSDSMAGKPWNTGIYRADYSAAGYVHVAALDATINSPYIDYSPFVSLDGRYLMFSSSRPSAEEHMFLYISFKGEDGTWSVPRKMNDALGFTGNARFPSISPDEKYLFFCGDDGNIYWADVSVIEKFRTR